MNPDESDAPPPDLRTGKGLSGFPFSFSRTDQAQLRWVAAFAVGLILLVAGPLLGRLPPHSALPLWLGASILAGYNVLLALRAPRRPPPWATRFETQLIVDCVMLAWLVHFGGGIDNPFLPLFVLHVVNANVVLPDVRALGILALAMLLVTLVVLGEGAGHLQHYCLRGDPDCPARVMDLYLVAILGGLLVTLVATSLFTRELTARLRGQQRRIEGTIAELNTETDRLHEAHAAVDLERSRLRALIDSMSLPILFKDGDGALVLANQPARDLWRLPSAEEPDGFPPLAELALLPGSRGESTFVREGRTFAATHSVVRSGRGEVLGLLTVARDVTDRLAMERHLMREEQMSVVGKLAASVAHEINNPIGVIFLYSQHALSALGGDSPVRKHIETIHRNADACRRIIGQLLNLARRQNPERRAVDLRQLCREVTETVAPIAQTRGVHLSGGHHAGDVPIWAQADRGMLRQAILNLALNAVEATPSGGEVAIGAYQTQDGDVAAQVIEVRDTGEGIPQEQRAEIFNPFFTTKEGGTGLGLAVADNITKSHGGRIELESERGSGSVFRILLPDAPVEARSAERPSSGAESVHEASS